MTIIRRITDFLLMPIPAAVGFLIGGLVVFFGGFLVTQTRQDLFAVIEQGYSNFGIELISIAATVLVIDGLNQRRASKERFQELIRQMRSKDNGLASAAVEILRLKGWLTDGSLKGANLWNANLQGVNLWNANLEGADLQNANLEGANLIETNLQGADLQNANLEGAILGAANLQGANLIKANLLAVNLLGANLQGADLRNANLQGAHLGRAMFNEKTYLPDDIAWTPDTDLSRFTDLNHPEFWCSL